MLFIQEMHLLSYVKQINFTNFNLVKDISERKPDYSF